MAGVIKKSVGKVKANPIGAVVGGAVAFWAAKRYGKVSKWYYLAGISLVGVIVGANAQGMIQSRMGSQKSGDSAKK